MPENECARFEMGSGKALTDKTKVIMSDQTKTNISYLPCNCAIGYRFRVRIRGPVSEKKLNKIRSSTWRLGKMLKLASKSDADSYIKFNLFYLDNMRTLGDAHTARKTHRILRGVETRFRETFPQYAAALAAEVPEHATLTPECRTRYDSPGALKALRADLWGC